MLLSKFFKGGGGEEGGNVACYDGKLISVYSDNCTLKQKCNAGIIPVGLCWCKVRLLEPIAARTETQWRLFPLGGPTPQKGTNSDLSLTFTETHVYTVSQRPSYKKQDGVWISSNSNQSWVVLHCSTYISKENISLTAKLQPAANDHLHMHLIICRAFQILLLLSVPTEGGETSHKTVLREKPSKDL